MFNLFKKKSKIIKKLKTQKIKENQALVFKDVLGQSIKLIRKLDGHSILLGLEIDDKQIVIDQELSIVLLSILKEYCMTNDIENSLALGEEKGENE